MTGKSEAKSEAFLGSATEGSTARTETPASEQITRTGFDPNCEDCCDPVTACHAHAGMPRDGLALLQEIVKHADPTLFDPDEIARSFVLVHEIAHPIAAINEDMRRGLNDRIEELERALDARIAERDDAVAATRRLLVKLDRLERFEGYVCGVIAMGTQADLTVEALPR